MLEVAANESDCEVIDKSITIISLDDSSQEEESDIGECAKSPKSLNVVTTLATSPNEIPEQAHLIEEGERINESKSTELLFEIKFLRKQTYDQLGELIIKAIQEKLEADDNIENSKEFKYCVCASEEKEDEMLIRVEKHKQQSDPLMNQKIEQRRERDRIKEQSPDLSGLSELFTIDTDPAKKLDSVQVPSYKRVIKDALLDEETETKKKEKQEKNCMKRPRQGGACFNCGATEHGLKDCPLPRDAKRIRIAKKCMPKTERYHADVGQCFAHMRPGCISDNLREAMGLKRGELPFMFYRMRYLGYPPGWLEDTKVEHSGITLFNSDGSAVLNSDEDEGEVDPRTYKYDASKIIDFPGFNQYPGENFYDDYKHHNVPPFDKRQLKDEFIKSLGDKVLKDYKRKKLKDLTISNTTAECSYNTTTLEVTDMEIEDPNSNSSDENVEFIRPPPPSMELSMTEEKPAPPPPISPMATTSEMNADKTAIGCDKDRSPSPSLEDLEAKQLLLLQELQANISGTTEHEQSTAGEILILDDSEENTNSSSNNNSKAVDELPSNSGNPDATKTLSEQVKDIIETHIKQSFIGTELIKFSPYDSLPTAENFKVGVSDVINFENLPDSTGKYTQIREILKKVRDTVHKLNN
uniref:CCHC-type domain-containing protein n=1 Tax=Glossina brevipalpis TaxID=37001 RepID=A0A1A9X4Y3_9MUSC